MKLIAKIHKTHLHGQNQPSLSLPLPQPPNSYEQTQKQEPDHKHHIPKIRSDSLSTTRREENPQGKERERGARDKEERTDNG